MKYSKAARFRRVVRWVVGVALAWECLGLVMEVFISWYSRPRRGLAQDEGE